jgi:hypothetical protein
MIKEDLQNILPLKKKRGRKSKNQLLLEAGINSSDGINIKTNTKINEYDNKLEPHNSSDNIILKKRGRKANSKLINLNQDSNNEIVTNLIAHLPLKMDDIMKIINETPVKKINKDNKLINDVKSHDLSVNILNLNDSPIKENKLSITNEPMIINDTVKTKITSNTKYVDLEDDIQMDKISKISTYCHHCAMYKEKIKQLNNEISDLKNGILNCTSNLKKNIFESNVNFYNTQQNDWVTETDIACWWCCHKFNYIPLGIPNYICKDKFYLFGCFCSFNCMLAYNLDINDSKIWDRQSYIYQMKNHIDPDNKINIHPAPPRQVLQMFGGPLSIQEYRESFYLVNKEYRYFLPPMISIVGLIEEDVKDNSYSSNKYNRLIIKRRKPLPKQSNDLNIILNKNKS